MPLPRIPKRGATGETARLITSQFNVTTPPGMTLDQSPTGQRWRDDRHKPFPARITGDGTGSGNGGGPSGSGWASFDHHYDWEEVVPISVNNEAVWQTKENGRTGTSNVRPAVEANGVTDVPIDSIVYLYAGPTEGMEPIWYYFWWSGELDSGSGNDAEYVTTCPDGTSYKIRIDGNTVTVTET